MFVVVVGVSEVRAAILVVCVVVVGEMVAANASLVVQLERQPLGDDVSLAYPSFEVPLLLRLRL